MTSTTLFSDLAGAWDLSELELLTADGLFSASLCGLEEVESRQPGMYALFEVGGSLLYRRANGFPLYVGSTACLRDRCHRHITNLEPVHDLAPEDFAVVAFPLPTFAAARAAEELTVGLVRPAWNASWLRGFGSKAPGARRSEQRRPSWSVLHPGRVVGRGATTVRRDVLVRRVTEHLEATVPPGVLDSRARFACGSRLAAA